MMTMIMMIMWDYPSNIHLLPNIIIYSPIIHHYYGKKNIIQWIMDDDNAGYIYIYIYKW